MTDAISSSQSQTEASASQLKALQKVLQSQQAQKAQPAAENDGDEATESGAQKAAEASRSVPTNPSVGGSVNTTA